MRKLVVVTATTEQDLLPVTRMPTSPKYYPLSRYKPLPAMIWTRPSIMMKKLSAMPPFLTIVEPARAISRLKASRNLDSKSP